MDEEPKRFNALLSGGETVNPHGITEWLMAALDMGATHMIVVWDSFDSTDYPIYVMPDQDVREVEEKTEEKVMEVYWLGGDLEAQVAMRRSFTYGPTPSS